MAELAEADAAADAGEDWGGTSYSE